MLFRSCGNKTRVQIREDTELKNFPLFCPKCHTIGFLVLVAGNLLCVLPGNWVAYSPFGLSSLTRISVVEPGIGISAVSAFGIEAAILTLMIAGILMWGYKKILN